MGERGCERGGGEKGWEEEEGEGGLRGGLVWEDYIEGKEGKICLDGFTVGKNNLIFGFGVFACRMLGSEFCC